jgi:ABC-type sulfate transport system permease component
MVFLPVLIVILVLELVPLVVLMVHHRSRIAPSMATTTAPIATAGSMAVSMTMSVAQSSIALVVSHPTHRAISTRDSRKTRGLHRWTARGRPRRVRADKVLRRARTKVRRVVR